jgi:NADH:ubiquinone oxidoreductase subunit 2 (subunit N)
MMKEADSSSETSHNVCHDGYAYPLQGHYLNGTTPTQNQHRQTIMARAGFEPMIPVLTSSVTAVAKSFNISFVNQTTIVNKKATTKFLLFITLLSLGGLPPFIGFLPK